MRKLSLILAVLLAIGICGSSASYAAPTHGDTVLVKKTNGKKHKKGHKKHKGKKHKGKKAAKA